MTAEQLLQEAIIDLQKRSLCEETRKLVEEAAQLLAEGRDIEARALVEKAQAISMPVAQPAANVGTKINTTANGQSALSGLISRLSGRLAQEIAAALGEAVEAVQRDLGARTSELAHSLETGFSEVKSRLESISSLRDSVDRLEREGAASGELAQERWDQISASILSLQETGRDRQDQAEHFKREISAAVETISFRITAQEERAGAVSTLFQDLSAKVLSLEEQIEAQTNQFRAMRERQAQRAAAFNAILDGIAKLREPKTAAAGQ